MPRKRFNKEEANAFWANYTKNLSDSITETEKEGLEKGYSSYQIELLWEQKTREKYGKVEKKGQAAEESKSD
jgi:hypothetical protein